MASLFTLGTAEYALWLSRTQGGYRLHRDGHDDAVISLRSDGPTDLLAVDGDEMPVAAARNGDELFLHLGGRTYAMRYIDPVERHASGATTSTEDDVRAPMPGVVLSVAVEPGQAVAPGDTVVVIESMKMETRCPALRSGTVAAVLVTPGQSFERDQVLVRLEKDA